MKFSLLFIVLTMLAVLFVCLMAKFSKHKNVSYRQQLRHGVRPFSPLEKFMLACVLGMTALASWFHRPFYGGNRIALANYLVTPPGESDSKIADEAIPRFRLVKIGTDADHIAMCDAGDIPIGFTRESSGAAADRVAFTYLGLSCKGAIGYSSGAIVAGNLLCPGTDGVLRDITLLNGTTVYVCGIALQSVATGKEFAWIPYAPTKLVIA